MNLEAASFYKGLGETRMDGELHNAMGDIYLNYMDIPESMVSRSEFAPLEIAYRNYEANPTVANAAAFIDEAEKVQRLASSNGYNVDSPYVKVNAAMEADAVTMRENRTPMVDIDSVRVVEDNSSQGRIKGSEDVSKNGLQDNGVLNEEILSVFMPDGSKVIDFTHLPGDTGIEIPRRLTADEMTYLTNEHGVEFAQIYRRGTGTNGAGGKYIIYSGDASSVKVPIRSDVILINHTHPGGTIYPSRADKKLLSLLEQAGSPQRTSEIIPIGNDKTIKFTKNGG